MPQTSILCQFGRWFFQITSQERENYVTSEHAAVGKPQDRGGEKFLGEIAHICAVIFYFFLVWPAWEHLLLCKCWVWTPGLIPLSGAARPLGVTSLSARVCVVDNGMDGSRITLSRTKESSCARWKAGVAHDRICWASVIHTVHLAAEITFRSKN